MAEKTTDEECSNCGHLNEVTEWESGCCEECGIEYHWEEMYDEDVDEMVVFLRWNC